MRQLSSTLPVGELIPAKPAPPLNVSQAQTIGYFRGDSRRPGLRFRNRMGYQNNNTICRLSENEKLYKLFRLALSFVVCVHITLMRLPPALHSGFVPCEPYPVRAPRSCGFEDPPCTQF